MTWFDFTTLSLFRVYEVPDLLAMWRHDQVTLDTMRRFGVLPSLLEQELRAHLLESNLFMRKTTSVRNRIKTLIPAYSFDTVPQPYKSSGRALSSASVLALRDLVRHI